ncbi:hypothetical protein ACFL0Y_04665 [Patescibacteria group bacterium]
MTINQLSGIVSAALVIFIIILPSLAYAKKKVKNWIFRIIVIFISLMISLILWYGGVALLGFPLGNLFPNMKGVHCFTLSKSNCERRPDCYVGVVYGGLGKDSWMCYNKPETPLIEEVL